MRRHRGPLYMNDLFVFAWFPLPLRRGLFKHRPVPPRGGWVWVIILPQVKMAPRLVHVQALSNYAAHAVRRVGMAL